jgi:hypothetical protein
MNRLKKRAWAQLAAVSIMALIAVPGFLYRFARDVGGIDYLIIGLITGIPAGLFIYRRKNRKAQQYDERERLLLGQAFNYGTGAFVLFFLIASFAAFFLVGGQGSVPVIFLPLMLFIGLFIAKGIESLILLRLAREDHE